MSNDVTPTIELSFFLIRALTDGKLVALDRNGPWIASDPPRHFNEGTDAGCGGKTQGYPPHRRGYIQRETYIQNR